MKKDYRLEEVLNYSTLVKSLDDCKKGMLWKNSVAGFDAYSEFYIFDILDRLYRDKPFYLNQFFHTKITERGKERLICSLTIRDRVICKAINQNFILPAFVPTIIYDNVASLKNRGMSQAIDRMECHLQKAYRQFGTDFYIVKCDIKSYFDSISNERCYNLLLNHTTDERLLHIFEILFRLFKYDSFVHNGEHVDFGLGLGGEIPQSFGIVYLNEFDHICKEKFRIPFYIRYMDDIIFIHNDKEYLKECLKYLEEYLDTIGLKFNDKKTMILHSSQGVKFLKFHFNITETGKVYILVDKKGIRREKRKLRKLADLLEDERITFTDIRQHYGSYKGHISRADSYEVINHLDQIFDEIFIYNWLLDYDY